MTFHQGRRLRVLGVFMAAVVTASAHQAPGGQPIQINGAGATLPYPIYSAWFAEYAKVNPNVRIHYLSIGSGAGIGQLREQLVFFAATDTPMTVEEFQEAPGRILHLPTVLAGIVPIYNVPGVKGDLKFDGPLLSSIFLGKVRNWNDPAILKLNPGVTLPATDIAVVYRSDSSGTSFIFADFLSKTVPEWNRLVGPTRTLNPHAGGTIGLTDDPFGRNTRMLNLPGGIGAGSNEQVAGAVKQTAGAIGYVELAYAVRNNIDMGAVMNSMGEFVRATPESITAAGAAIGDSKDLMRDFRVSITNAPGKGVYPISSFTWILLYERPSDLRRSKAMVDFVRWALTEGQKLAPQLGYAPLPPEVIKRELELLATIRVS